MPKLILPKTTKNNYWDNSTRLFDQYEQIASAKLRVEYRRLYEDTLKKVKSMLYDLQSPGKMVTVNDLYTYDRYYEMLAEFRQKMISLGEKEISVMDKALTDMYEANSAIIGKAFGFPYVNDNKVKQAIQQIWCQDGLSWSDRIWKHKDQLTQLVSEGIVNSVARGDSSRELARTLQKTFGVGYSQAKRLATTELAHVQIKSATDKYQEAGIQYYKVLVAPAENVCEECSELSNMTFPVDQIVLPAHPNCRCCTIAILDKER